MLAHDRDEDVVAVGEQHVALRVELDDDVHREGAGAEREAQHAVDAELLDVLEALAAQVLAQLEREHGHDLLARARDRGRVDAHGRVDHQQRLGRAGLVRIGCCCCGGCTAGVHAALGRAGELDGVRVGRHRRREAVVHVAHAQARQLLAQVRGKCCHIRSRQSRANLEVSTRTHCD